MHALIIKQDQIELPSEIIDAMREELAAHFEGLPIVEKVYPSDANFLLVKLNKDAVKVYEHLLGDSIVVRDRSKVKLCEGCLRITVGTEEENNKLIESFNRYKE